MRTYESRRAGLAGIAAVGPSNLAPAGTRPVTRHDRAGLVATGGATVGATASTAVGAALERAGVIPLPCIEVRR